MYESYLPFLETSIPLHPVSEDVSSIDSEDTIHEYLSIIGGGSTEECHWPFYCNGCFYHMAETLVGDTV